MTITTFDVVREHIGDKHYVAGDTRRAELDEVGHLVPTVLVPAKDAAVEQKAAATPRNKNAAAPLNKSA